MDDILSLLPTALARSGDTDKLRDVKDRLIQLDRQALALAVREWFEAHPDFNKPFQLGQMGLMEYHFVDQPNLAMKERVALNELVDLLQEHHGPGTLGMLGTLLGKFNGVQWQRTHVDAILGSVVDNYIQVGAAALFAMADQAKLDQDTPSSEPQGRSPRL